MERYSKIKEMKDIYNEVINSESTIKKLYKRELFNESKLKINLKKYFGYDLKLDGYRFQGEFMKIYKRAIPKKMMTDILKNNL